MPYSPLYYKSDAYLKTIESIGNIKFTPREVDVLAGLLRGKSDKVLANLLALSVRTIQFHLTNIREKLSYNFRNNIIEFLEKSDKHSILENHYQYLRMEKAFKEALQKIVKLKNKKQSITIFYDTADQSFTAHSKIISHYLHLAGFKTILVEKDKNESSLFPSHTSFKNTDCIIHILDKKTLESLKLEENVRKWEKSSSKKKPASIIFLSFNESPLNEKINSIEHIDFSHEHLFYGSFFMLLQRILPDINLTGITTEFHHLSKKTPGPIESKASHITTEAKETIVSKKRFFAELFKNYKNKIIVGSLLFFSICGAWLLMSGEEHRDAIQTFQSIRSNLRFSTESALLKRPALIKQIEEKLSQQKGIQTIALIGITGMGGVGKTTLARQFGQLQNSSIVWEINAETKDSLINSFKDLAYALAKTKDERDKLNFIQSIQDPVLKEKQLLSFVENNLKSHPNWLLIYDNVDEFVAAKDYLPQDNKIWGNGKVIITSRDSNIQNTSYISPNSVLELGELNPSEALMLFSKILYNCEPDQLSPGQKEKVLNFLKHIPSFPLDISHAAYYMKATHISYEEYLKEINSYSESFETTQKNILRGVDSYEKTRYGIISLSFKRLIDTNPDYKGLLLFICLLDSQNIPKNLLENYKDSKVINSFIHALRKYSLITSESSIVKNNEIQTFSLHRSTQSLGKVFLLDLLKEKEDEKRNLIQGIVASIKSYYEADAKNNPKNILLVIPHLEPLIKNLETITLEKKLKEKCKEDLFMIAGYAHYKFSRTLKLAKKYFIQVFNMHTSNNKQSPIYAKMLEDLGYACTDLGDLDEALIYTKASIEQYKRIPNSRLLIAKNLVTIGMVYVGQNNFEKANYHFKEALNKISKVDVVLKKEIESEIYQQLASLYSKTYINKKEAYEAEKYSLKSLERYNASNLFCENSQMQHKKIPCSIIKLRYRLGKVYSRMGKYKDANEKGFKEAQYIMDYSSNNCGDLLLKAHLLECVGEVLLRNGNLKNAKHNLTEALRSFENLVGEFATLAPKTLRAETLIRLGEFIEAYNDCLYVFQLKKRETNNFYNLMYSTCFYHAAFIKYKQNDLKKSIEHFADFFKAMNIFCKGFLDEKAYKTLENKGAFTISSYDPKHVKKDVKTYLKNSIEIFTAIYGSSHPFVRDYIIPNYNEATKPWWKFF